MSKYKKISVISCLLLILGGLIYWVVVPDNSDANLYESPIPSFLTIPKNNQISILDFWLPFISSDDSSSVPEHSAKGVLMYDLVTDKTLYESNAKKRVPMAPLTKIMTAIISLENPRPDDTYRVKGEDLVGEDSMGLVNGESLTLKELLYGLMLPSGNDAAEVLARNYVSRDGIQKGRTAFVKAMNDRAKAMGLVDTSFSNPSGLQGDGVQYTTPYDLLVMTRYALDTFPLFSSIVSTYEHTLPATDSHQEYYLLNETNLLSTYPGVKGVKTGYTPEAGMCLISYLDYKGHKIIGILLNSEDRRGEMRQFLDYSLTALRVSPPSEI